MLRGGMGAKDRAAAIARLQPQPGAPPLLAVATGPYAGEGFDCPALDTLFLAAPVAQKRLIVQCAGRILRPYDGKTTAEAHDCHDELTGMLASSLAKRAPGYTSLGFPTPGPLTYPQGGHGGLDTAGRTSSAMTLGQRFTKSMLPSPDGGARFGSVGWARLCAVQRRP